MNDDTLIDINSLHYKIWELIEQYGWYIIITITILYFVRHYTLQLKERKQQITNLNQGQTIGIFK